MRLLSRLLLAVTCATGALLLQPTAANATILFEKAQCVSSEGCDQSLAFSSAPTGTTIVGDTNPPKPLYDVYATLLDSTTDYVLHGTGSTIDTKLANDLNKDGPGFLSLELRPDPLYTWGAIEFQLNSLLKLGVGANTITLTAWDLSNTAYSQTFDFPWEGDMGQNQHYKAYGIDDGNGVRQVITKLRLTLNPGTTGNTLEDIHNIDFNTLDANGNPIVPEPATLTLLGLGLVGLGCRARRKA